MKNYILLIFTFCFVVSIIAQDKVYVNLWYGKVKNENVEKHLELEEKFFSLNSLLIFKLLLQLYIFQNQLL